MSRPSLAQHIAEDLRRRLASSDAAAVSLKLESLSQEYGCSTRPVRAALDQLAEEGFLDKQPNGRIRLAVTVSPKPSASAEARPQPVRDPLPDIAQHIVRLGLSSSEAFVREEETAERLSLSRAQMRQCFQRLSGEGILEHVPRRGWKARPFSQKDLQDFLAARETLELKALDIAWPRLERATIAVFLERNQHGPSPSRSKIDNGLHQYWIDLSDNRYIQEFFQRQAPYFSILFKWEDNDRQAVSEAIHAHREILAAILADKPARAKQALSQHILTTHPVIERLAASTM